MRSQYSSKYLNEADFCVFSKSTQQCESIVRQRILKFLPDISTIRLAEFAANMVCYMWNTQFSSVSFTASADFKAFCSALIFTTEMSSTIILTALQYIHRLKSHSPSAGGNKGSEYRLFTVALILASKFLDDATYTNKTWAEVTRIPVEELNLMELEFLIFIDFDLYASEKEFIHWLQCLGHYWNRQELRRTQYLDLGQRQRFDTSHSYWRKYYSSQEGRAQTLTRPNTPEITLASSLLCTLSSFAHA
ncbi:hypothetical protein K7432_013987 [Basidiobolus ranarum]|uniref:Cyclin n=1 Tax=Basidiobolus ranarum TaxID=34480 RepID=A0ABR2WIB2_9FUNG